MYFGKTMSLENDVSHRGHYSISLRCGRKITMKSLMQEMTYGDLIEGVPTSKMNDNKLKWIDERMRRDGWFAGQVPFLIPPVRRDFLREPGDMASNQHGGRVPEWMPAITCIGRFASHPTKNPNMNGSSLFIKSSSLLIIWFQEDYAMPISEIALQAIIAIDWNSHAKDFEY